MLKKLDKKFLYLCGALILVPLLIILLLVLIRGCNSSVSAGKYEDKMLKAAKKHFEKKNTLPVSEGGEVSVTLDDLIDEEYIKDPDKYVSDKNCTGYVKVINNGMSYKDNKGGFYLYIPYLTCDKYQTTHIIDKLLEDVVTSESGLYQVDDGYVYKGSKVNNYVKFADKLYRIISIDNNNVMKLVKIDQEKNRVQWDNKFNVEKNRVYGKNDYSDSSIIDVLKQKYDKFSSDQKKHLMAYNICYGNRSESYDKIDKQNECSKILENQFVTLMNSYDYANASYDVDCVGISSGACRNYNYIFDSLTLSWLVNGNADNTYEVYYYSQGYVDVAKANSSKKYNIVIYISADELYTKGNGSLESPYIIK